MMKNLWLFLIPLMLMGMFMGCAAGISKQARSAVTYHDTFARLQQRLQGLIGETVILGGKIIAIETLQSTTELMILHLTLDDRDYPRDNDRSEGRFLVVSDQFLDPAIYKKGDLITVVGKVVSAEKRLIGEREYRYPKIKVREIKLWMPGRDTGPRIRFGIGIGASF